MLQMGMSHRHAVLSIYGVSLVLSLSAIILTLLTHKQAAIFLVVLSTIVLVAANKIGVTRAGSRAPYLTQSNKQQRSSRM